MNLIAALLAALLATGFAVDLGLDWRRKPRSHAGMWTAAMGMYALATWALVVGLATGWDSVSFRMFYWLGAVANIPVLAAGSVYLVLGAKAGKRFTTGVLIWVFLGGVASWMAPLSQAIAGDEVPEGKELFDWSFDLLGIAVPGPRVFAALAGGVATLIIVGLASYSALRFWNSNRRLAVGNILIVMGTLSPAFGGSLTALGEAAGFAIALLVGAILLWIGYRVASGSRAQPSAPTRPGPPNQASTRQSS